MKNAFNLKQTTLKAYAFLQTLLLYPSFAFAETLGDVAERTSESVSGWITLASWAALGLAAAFVVMGGFKIYAISRHGGGGQGAGKQAIMLFLAAIILFSVEEFVGVGVETLFGSGADTLEQGDSLFDGN